MTTVLQIVESLGPVSVLTLQGKIDGDTFRGLVERAEKLIEAGRKQLIIDMAGVSYMSSAGLVALQSIHNKLHAVGGRLAVAALTGDVARVVEMTGPPDWLNIFPDVAGAKASFD